MECGYCRNRLDRCEYCGDESCPECDGCCMCPEGMGEDDDD